MLKKISPWAYLTIGLSILFVAGIMIAVYMTPPIQRTIERKLPMSSFLPQK